MWLSQGHVSGVEVAERVKWLSFFPELLLPVFLDIQLHLLFEGFLVKICMALEQREGVRKAIHIAKFLDLEKPAPGRVRQAGQHILCHGVQDVSRLFGYHHKKT